MGNLTAAPPFATPLGVSGCGWEREEEERQRKRKKEERETAIGPDQTRLITLRFEHPNTAIIGHGHIPQTPPPSGPCLKILNDAPENDRSPAT